MGVYLGAIYQDVVDELNNGENSRLSARFIRAVNRALSQLENKADTGTDFAIYSSKEDTVTELDAKHEYILYTGTMFWLYRMGERPGDPRVATAVLNDTESQWRAAIGDYTKDKLNDDQTTGGLDIANIGYVG